jgi:hypothetical protein
MNNHDHLSYRAAAAIDAHNRASGFDKVATARELVDVKAQLEQTQREDAALQVFKATPPQSSFGAWIDKTVQDHPVFFYAAGSTRILRPVRLPDGSTATPNPEGQICVPAYMAPAMIARGYVRVNDGGTRELDPGARTMRAPTQVQGA